MNEVFALKVATNAFSYRNDQKYVKLRKNYFFLLKC